MPIYLLLFKIRFRKCLTCSCGRTKGHWSPSYQAVRLHVLYKRAYSYQLPSPLWLSRSEGLHKASFSGSGQCTREYRRRAMRTRFCKKKPSSKLCWKKAHLIFSIKIIAGFEPWCVQSTLVVLQSLGTERRVRGSNREQTAQLWSRIGLQSRDLHKSKIN